LRDTRKDKGEGIDHWRTHERLRLEGEKKRERASIMKMVIKFKTSGDGFFI